MLPRPLEVCFLLCFDFDPSLLLHDWAVGSKNHAAPGYLAVMQHNQRRVLDKQQQLSKLPKVSPRVSAVIAGIPELPPMLGHAAAPPNAPEFIPAIEEQILSEKPKRGFVTLFAFVFDSCLIS